MLLSRRLSEHQLARRRASPPHAEQCSAPRAFKLACRTIPALLVAGVCFAQFRPRPDVDPRSGLPNNFVRLEGGLVVNEDELQTARETDTHSTGTPTWTNAPGFERDVFTFTRVIF